jgi:RNA polymerase sigma-70 factor (ECF subfamily)
LALLVVLDTLDPAERLAFVLHDLFAIPFEEIAPIVDRTPTATRMLASRARRRVRGAGTTYDRVDVARQQEIVEAFLAAARGGDLQGLLELLDPDVVLRADATSIAAGAIDGLHGAQAVASTFSGRARGAHVKLLDGLAGWLWAEQGRRKVAFVFTVVDDKIAEIALVGDHEPLTAMEITDVP